VVSVKGGVVGGRSVTAEEIGRIAELPPRDILLAQLLGAFQAPAARALAVMQAPARQVAGLVEALRTKLEGGEAAT
jgi:large subunit ribosomal protein L10